TLYCKTAILAKHQEPTLFAAVALAAMPGNGDRQTGYYERATEGVPSQATLGLSSRGRLAST
ncbi:MAG TPA: hypothetical protein VM366_09025, partial [Anaerolineae bacterium]|nr:hypothetical protein [Anaerolineae bacterium]